ncbi:DDE-type integrase/transposase/recombinase [Spirosoma utsteinense]|uniref:DDE-type integrase/transposase/recombinase n=1 Tax=Spirosoma utsteinense TaxID=2585773 RepID=UPI0037431999
MRWDIKYVWVQGERRNYYLLSVIDVYSRKILDWLFQSSIRQIDLINLFRRINRSHQLKGVILRNDNGSQFIAYSVRNFLKSSEIKQEFTHVATGLATFDWRRILRTFGENRKYP